MACSSYLFFRSLQKHLLNEWRHNDSAKEVSEALASWAKEEQSYETQRTERDRQENHRRRLEKAQKAVFGEIKKEDDGVIID